LTLAAGGTFGVLSYSVAQRSHEIGVRMALGSNRWRVMKLVLREAVIMSVVGSQTAQECHDGKVPKRCRDSEAHEQNKFGTQQNQCSPPTEVSGLCIRSIMFRKIR
jgi:hypothetical protein